MSILQRREELGVQRGIEKGIEKGIEEGRRARSIEVAKNLLREGAEIALVAKATDLSKSEVEKLKKELNK